MLRTRAPARVGEVIVPRGRWGIAFALAVTISLAGLLAAPWPMQDKSVALLHGLCAQRPSHSFWFGDWRLPFDARMTGIYGAFLITQIWLLARGRLRTTGIPSPPILITLVLFVMAMGLDGVNSLFDDLALPALYAPNNLLRYATGALTGTTLGIFVWLLVTSAIWRPDQRANEPLLRGWWELLILVGLSAVFGAVVHSGWTVLYAPIALSLVLAAGVVLFLLALAAIQIIRGEEHTVVTLRDLAFPATGALVTAWVIMFGLSAARYLLETLLDVRPLP